MSVSHKGTGRNRAAQNRSNQGNVTGAPQRPHKGNAQGRPTHDTPDPEKQAGAEQRGRERA